MLWYFIGACGLAILGVVGFWAYVMASVEKAPYETVEADGSIEIRAYPPLVTAETRRSGSRYDAVRSGFSPLAGYIFAKEREG